MKKRTRKRVGRGSGSGHGTYSGRGLKGQKARSGGNLRPGFEGGRMPLTRQLPKLRGFKSHRPKSQIVKLKDLEEAFKDGEVVSPKTLFEKRLIENPRGLVKILGGGKLTKKLGFKDVKKSKSVA